MLHIPIVVSRFLRARMDRRTAGGFLLTAGIAVILAVAFVVGAILEMIDDRSGLARADRSVAEWGSHHDTTGVAHALKWVTHLGSIPVLAPMLLLVAWSDFARRRSREVFAFVASVYLGELLLNNVLKLIVRRERPDVLHLVEAHGYSFPSGHTAAAAAALSAIALVLGRDRSRMVRALLTGAAVQLTLLVATSRALLGVHWLTDVVAGLAIGWGWFGIVALIFGGRAQRLGDPVSDHPQAHALL